MDFETLKQRFEQGMALLAQGRQAIAGIRSAVTDGSAALKTSEKDELLAMLDKEEEETKAAIADARDAIADYRAGG